MAYEIHLADCLEWLESCPERSFEAVITDPPFGVREYTHVEIEKRRAGRGGVWRIPPSFDGSNRSPLPRFTVLDEKDLKIIRDFFYEWGKRLYPTLVPGAHIFIAANPILSHIVWSAIVEAGFEKRGEIVRLVRTFRGGDRPKGAEAKFRRVSSMPRACWEPWGLFRRPLEGRLADNLSRWSTGGLRRISEDAPFCDVIGSGRTPQHERELAPHPSLKPQHFLRQLVWASLPLGRGSILDPFAGSGSTLAAAEALGYDSVGIEIDEQYYEVAKTAIPKLAALEVAIKGHDLSRKHPGYVQEKLPVFGKVLS